MTNRGEDTDPTGARSIEDDTDPGSPQGRARQDLSAAKDGAEDLDRILGGLRSEGHFRPEPTQTASTNGESFAAHSVAPHSLAAANTDPKLDRILLDITSPDGISPETGAEPDDASAVTVPLPRPTTRAPSPQEDVATGPDMFRVLREQRRRERVALYGLCAVVLAGLIGGWIAIRPSRPASPAASAASAVAPEAMATTPATVTSAATTVPFASSSVTAPAPSTATPPDPPKRSAPPPASVLPARPAGHLPLVSPKEEDDDIGRGRR